LFGGTLVCGSAMTIIATFLPFTYLNDLISAGILVAFSMTDSCLVLLRCESPASRPYLLEQCLVVYNASCLLTALLWSHTIWFLPGPLHAMLATLLTGLTIASFLYLMRHCPQSAHFGGSILWQPLATQNNIDHGGSDSTTDHHFQTPLVPYLPCLGMAINWYLVAQLEARGILLLVCYLGLTVLIYLCGCAHHSHGHNHNWSRRTYYETIADATAAEKGDDDFSSTDENNADDVTLSMRPMLHPQIGVEAKENRRASFG